MSLACFIRKTLPLSVTMLPLLAFTSACFANDLKVSVTNRFTAPLESRAPGPLPPVHTVPMHFQAESILTVTGAKPEEQLSVTVDHTINCEGFVARLTGSPGGNQHASKSGEYSKMSIVGGGKNLDSGEHTADSQATWVVNGVSGSKTANVTFYAVLMHGEVE